MMWQALTSVLKVRACLFIRIITEARKDGFSALAMTHLLIHLFPRLRDKVGQAEFAAAAAEL